MAKTKSKADWWDTFMLVGAFLLVLIFLYQLLKLWQAGTQTISSFFSSIPQALTNTLAAVESGLSSLVSNPLATVASWFDSLPAFLSGILGGLIAVVASLFGVTGLFAGLASIFSGIGLTSLAGAVSGATTGLGATTATNTLPITNGLGSSYLGVSSSPVFLGPTTTIGPADPNSSTFSATQSGNN